MSKTVSFVAKDELAEWLESRADEEMKSISSVCQDIIAEEYRRQHQGQTDKGEQSPENGGESEEDAPEPLSGETMFEMGSKPSADAVREEFSEYLSEGDDRRLTEVSLAEGTPGEVVAEVKRRQN